MIVRLHPSHGPRPKQASLMLFQGSDWCDDWLAELLQSNSLGLTSESQVRAGGAGGLLKMVTDNDLDEDQHTKSGVNKTSTPYLE